MNFFGGSGTTAHAVLAQNALDEAGRRFIVVSNTESTADDPNKNLCRDVCAARIRRMIAGYGEVSGLGGDFAYLRTRRVAEEDVLYDLDPPSLWMLLQLRQDHPLRALDPHAIVQLSLPAWDAENPATLAYAPSADEAVIAVLRGLAGEVQVFTPTPGVLRDAFDRPGITIEFVPDRLLAEFRRNLVGL